MEQKSYYIRLPDNYHQKLKLDFKNDKRLRSWVIISAVIALAAFAAIYIFGFSWNAGKFTTLGAAPIVGLALGLIGSGVLHEAIHLLCVALYGWKQTNIRIGQRIVFAYPCSPDGYYSKEAFYTILLLPVILIGIALLITLAIVRYQAFFVVYVIFAFNIAFSLGDIYAACAMSKLPIHVVVSDNAESITCYVRKLSKKANKDK